MVDRPNRLKAAALIEQFVAGSITNFQFQDRFPRSDDPALRAINTALWFSYSDIREHQLNGMYALGAEARNVFDRCVLFLRTDAEYTGTPSFGSLAAPFKRLWNRVMGRADSEMSATWPFDSAQELECSQKSSAMRVIAKDERKPAPPDDDIAWLFPPCDIHDHAVWDRYWQDRIRHGLYPPRFDIFCFDAPLIECLIKRGAKTVLCAGNGISQEPRALAAAGFDVSAMDLSPEAVHVAQNWQFSSKELDRFCTKEQQVPGGRAVFVVGDIMDQAVCAGPFDVIIERRMLQLFPEEERGLALDALASRLHAGGLFLSHCHDGGWRPPNKPVHYVEQFFRDRGWPVTRFAPEQSGRVAWLVLSTG